LSRAPAASGTWVEVALPLPLFRTFTYRIDGALPPPGTRVLVPFQRSELVGWVVGEGDPTGITGIRSVLDVLERTPCLPADMVSLGRWIGEYYVCPEGLTFRSMLPSVLSDGAREVLRITEAGRAGLQDEGSGVPAEAGVPARPAAGTPAKTPDGAPARASRAALILSELESRGGQAPVASLRRAIGRGSIWPEIRSLGAAGLVEHETLPPPSPPVRSRRVVRLREWIEDLGERELRFGRAARQRECYEFLEASGGGAELGALLDGGGFSRSVITGLEEKGIVEAVDEEVLRDPFRGEPSEKPQDFPPTPAQAAAVETLVGALDQRPLLPFLLHGITGSGKTLVYIRLLQEVVGRRGRSAIVLVPEISLTPQTVKRFRAWFGDEVAVLHSALSPGERYDQWRQIRRGDKRVVVGARSALFAPVPDLGAVIVDEEHDGSYKQSEAPRYHARDVAVVRARLAGAICVLGSATPSLESWRNVEAGKFRALSLPERVGGRSLPPVEVVDLRKHRAGAPGPEDGGTILSPRLVEAVRERLDRGEQSILLLNRRGYASFVQCRGCGDVRDCPNCSVSLTFHRGRGRMLCHHCRHEEPVPDRCSGCGEKDLSFLGLGTERVERTVVEAFPGARIARMDVDTTSGKWSHHEILGKVERGEVDLLLGTQMIAKGLDFPRVTLVGVVNADVGIHLPDFRASERSFQLLSQVAGRAGRGELGGQVIIQSSLPEHYAIQAAVEHDVHGFVKREMEERRSPPYPPHLRLANVIVSSPDRALVADGAEGAARWVRGRVDGAREGAEVVGPAPSPIERLHGRWRWHFFIRGGGVGRVGALLRSMLEEYSPPPGDVRIVVDRDPVALL